MRQSIPYSGKGLGTAPLWRHHINVLEPMFHCGLLECYVPTKALPTAPKAAVICVRSPPATTAATPPPPPAATARVTKQTGVAGSGMQGAQERGTRYTTTTTTRKT